MDHSADGHFYASLGLLAGVGLLWLVVRNSWIRRRLHLTGTVAASAVVLHLALSSGPWLHRFAAQISVIEQLLLSLGLIHGVVTLAWIPAR